MSFSTVLRGCSRPLRLHFSTTCTAFSFPSLLCTRPHSSPIQAYRCHPAKRELLSFTLLCNNSNFGTQAYFSYLFFCSICAFELISFTIPSLLYFCLCSSLYQGGSRIWAQVLGQGGHVPPQYLGFCANAVANSYLVPAPPMSICRLPPCFKGHLAE